MSLFKNHFVATSQSLTSLYDAYTDDMSSILHCSFSVRKIAAFLPASSLSSHNWMWFGKPKTLKCSTTFSRLHTEFRTIYLWSVMKPYILKCERKSMNPSKIIALSPVPRTEIFLLPRDLLPSLLRSS